MQSKYQQELNQVNRENEIENIWDNISMIGMLWDEDADQTELDSIISRLTKLSERAYNVDMPDLVMHIDALTEQARNQKVSDVKEQQKILNLLSEVGCVASGTMACLLSANGLNEDTYKVLDFVQDKWFCWVRDQGAAFEHWKAAWFAFVDAMDLQEIVELAKKPEEASPEPDNKPEVVTNPGIPYIHISDLVAQYKRQGLSKQLAWNQYVKDIILAPRYRTDEADAKTVYHYYELS